MSQPTAKEVREWFHEDFVKLHGYADSWSKETHNAYTCQLAMLLRFVGWCDAQRIEASKERCQKEFADLNDPPCHPSDDDWRPCHLCDGSKRQTDNTADAP